jgi:membrane dipeptidase
VAGGEYSIGDATMSDGPMTLALISWSDLTDGRADAFDGAPVVVSGWIAPIDYAERHDYFLLSPNPICCIGCLPNDPHACIEVFADPPITNDGREVRLTGRWRRLVDDPTGWRYQLVEARLLGPAVPSLTRRGILAGAALLGIATPWASAAARSAGTDVETPAPPVDPAALEAARAAIASTVAIDIHSHAGRVITRREGERPFEPVTEPMRDGGMAAICLAMVADTPTTRVTEDRRIVAFRDPEPGELYAWSKGAFERLRDLVARERLAVISDAASLKNARAAGPAVVVASEGADYLEGLIDRVDEAHKLYGLRHLQLTHYRPNELGDIQTVAPKHGGLTDFGAAVIKRCNALGIVVDIAHGTYDLVKRAAAVTSKPLILSHTSLTLKPPPYTRLITPDHARVVAGTGGVIGIWPPQSIFPTMDHFAAGMARMVDVVGVDHVGLGSDMLGLTGPSTFDSYRRLPELAAALLAAGFHQDETTKILGGNYLRVFTATVG